MMMMKVAIIPRQFEYFVDVKVLLVKIYDDFVVVEDGLRIFFNVVAEFAEFDDNLCIFFNVVAAFDEFDDNFMGCKIYIKMNKY